MKFSCAVKVEYGVEVPGVSVEEVLVVLHGEVVAMSA